MTNITIPAEMLRRWPAWIGFASLALLFTVQTACGGADNAALAKKGAPRFPVTAVVAQPKAVPIFQEFIGATFALNTVQVNSRVNGYIDKWLFRPGDFVAEGQLLYVIDQRTYRADLQKAAAEARTVRGATQLCTRRRRGAAR